MISTFFVRLSNFSLALFLFSPPVFPHTSSPDFLATPAPTPNTVCMSRYNTLVSATGSHNAHSNDVVPRGPARTVYNTTIDVSGGDVVRAITTPSATSKLDVGVEAETASASLNNRYNVLHLSVSGSKYMFQCVSWPQLPWITWFAAFPGVTLHFM